MKRYINTGLIDCIHGDRLTPFPNLSYYIIWGLTQSESVFINSSSGPI